MHEMDGALVVPGWLVGCEVYGIEAPSLRAGTRNLEPLFQIIIRAW